MARLDDVVTLATGAGRGVGLTLETVRVMFQPAHDSTTRMAAGAGSAVPARVGVPPDAAHGVCLELRE